IDKAKELTEVADIGLESIQHFFKSLVDWAGITPRLATFCTRGYRNVVRLEGEGRSDEITPAMRIAHSIHDAAGRARKPDVDFCLEKAFKTVAYMYQFYGMIGQSAESLSKLSEYEKQRYWIIMQFCSMAQKGRLKDLPKSDMLFLTLVLSSELNGLSLAYKKGGKRALTQAVTYKALDMLETYAVDYCVKQLLKRSKIESRLGFLSPTVRSGLMMLVELGSSSAISGCLSDWKRRVALMMPDLLFGAEDIVRPEKLTRKA
ncbi:MAG: hypothetical protein GWP59_04050, partial [Chlamydiales bacterium]|nr:hypothetical protein [Chlamydiales bacterium]